MSYKPEYFELARSWGSYQLKFTADTVGASYLIFKNDVNYSRFYAANIYFYFHTKVNTSDSVNLNVGFSPDEVGTPPTVYKYNDWLQNETVGAGWAQGRIQEVMLESEGGAARAHPRLSITEGQSAYVNVFSKTGSNITLVMNVVGFFVKDYNLYGV